MDFCLYGATRDDIPQVYIKSAFDLGAALGRRGHSLVFGAGATGLMGAAARGVRSQGGRLIGVAPRFFDEPGVLIQTCDEMVFTEDMRQRKKVMEERADGFIAVPGGIGTMDEFFEILTLRSLGRHNKRIAVFNPDGYYDELLAFLQKMEAQHFISPELWGRLGIFSDPDPLISYLEQ